jgi:hypothetical protein
MEFINVSAVYLKLSFFIIKFEPMGEFNSKKRIYLHIIIILLLF